MTRNTTSASADTSKHAIRPSAKTPTLTCRNIPSAARAAKHPQIERSNVAAIGKYRTRGRCPNFVRRRPENAIVSAKINIKAPITRLATVQTISSGRWKKDRSIGSSAKKRGPILAPNIHDKDQMSRGCQPVEDPPRIATTNPENPARATAICETVKRNPSLPIFDTIGLTITRSATAGKSECELQWMCFHEMKRGHMPASRWLHPMVRRYHHWLRDAAWG